MRRALVLGSDVKGMTNLVGVVSEYLHQPASGITMFDDVEPETLRDITTIVIFDRHGNPFVFTVDEVEDDIDLEADTQLERVEDGDRDNRPRVEGSGTAPPNRASHSGSKPVHANRKRKVV